MRNLKDELINREIAYDQLLDNGFVQEGDHYFLKTFIGNQHFQVIIDFSKDQQTSKVIDLESGEEYILVDIKNASGSFVETLKNEYEQLLQEVMNKCTTMNSFQNKQTHLVIQYLKDHYQDELEYLWEKFPQDAIVRNKKNQKWYGVFMTVAENKLGLPSDNMTEIIDLRYEKGKTDEIVDHKSVFAGYHMNKNSWITVKLDNSMPIEKIYRLIDQSYELSLHK